MNYYNVYLQFQYNRNLNILDILTYRNQYTRFIINTTLIKLLKLSDSI